jgi:hypothetical protein
MVIVEQSVEWRLAGETEVLGENLPRRHFVHHKSHLTIITILNKYVKSRGDKKDFTKNNLILYVFPFVDHSGRAVQGMNTLRPLEPWDRGFESYSRHGCLYCKLLFCICLFCVQVAALRRADPPSKESYRLCIR